jgi:hypothetical protein
MEISEIVAEWAILHGAPALHAEALCERMTPTDYL